MTGFRIGGCRVQDLSLGISVLDTGCSCLGFGNLGVPLRPGIRSRFFCIYLSIYLYIYMYRGKAQSCPKHLHARNPKSQALACLSMFDTERHHLLSSRRP